MPFSPNAECFRFDRRGYSRCVALFSVDAVVPGFQAMDLVDYGTDDL